MQGRALAFPHVCNLFSPRQTCLADVPRLPFNISNAVVQLPATNMLRLRRARLIAPVLLGEQRIPVTPLPNPSTGASHHSIVLEYPEDKTRKVMLFFDDTDLNFKGFSRALVTMTPDGPREEWGRCFVFNDKYRSMPQFLRPVKMGLLLAHSGKGDAPGPQAMEDMFLTFAHFEDMVEIDVTGTKVVELMGQMKRELMMAVGRAIIVFSEALRLKSLYHEVRRSLRGKEYSIALADELWALIRAWGKLSTEVQTMRRQHRTTLNSDLDRTHDKISHGFVATKLGQIIGRQGELKLAKLEVNEVITKSEIQTWEDDRATISLADPLFHPAKLARRGRGGEGGRGRGGEGRGRGVGGRGRGVGGRGRGGEGRGRGRHP